MGSSGCHFTVIRVIRVLRRLRRPRARIARLHAEAEELAKELASGSGDEEEEEEGGEEGEEEQEEEEGDPVLEAKAAAKAGDREWVVDCHIDFDCTVNWLPLMGGIQG